MNKGVIKKAVVFIVLTTLIFYTVSSSLIATDSLSDNSNLVNTKYDSKKYEIINFDDNNDIEWDVTINFSESGGVEDYVIFGEAINATDGPPHDEFDTPKPPAPQEPYIRAWFYDGMSAPYNLLFYDYRSYPDTYKVWNLTIRWIDVFPPDDTIVNISWDTGEFTGCEYNSVTLYEGHISGSLVEVADMLINTTYSFTAEDSVYNYFTIIGEAVNDPPVAVDDSYSVDEGDTLNVAAPGVLDNDYDNESDPLTAVLDDSPSHASSFTLNSDGSFEYVHDGSETTSDSFTYHANDSSNDSNIATVTITITPVNDPPVAVDDSYSVDEGDTLNVAAPGVLGNDDDNESDPLTAVLDSGPSHASSFTLNSDGSFEYVHDGGEDTSDSFTYHANDGNDDSNIATVTITITPVNDPPVAVDDSYSVDEGDTLNVAAPGVLGNDDDNESDPLTAVLDSGPGYASSFTLNSDGSFEYVHDGSETTSDSFTYHANDGTDDSNIATVTITITPVNDPPVAVDDSYSVDEGDTLNVPAPGVLGNDDDNESDPLTAVLDSGPSHASSFTLNSDGSFEYVHDGTGTSDSFTYHANDGTDDSNIATVTITINPINDPPVAVDDSYSVDEGGTLNVAAPGVLDNDYDNESDPLTAVLDDGPSHASSFTLNSDGSFEYVHDGSETTSDSFTYHANDGNNDSNIATVSITINPVNDPPVADFTFEPSNPSTSDIIYFNSTSTDPDGSIVNWTWDFDDGSFAYGEIVTHQYDDDGSYDVVLTVTDNDGATDTDIQTVTVSNIPPVAVDDTASTPEDTSVVIDVLENDYDIDGEIDPTTVYIVDDANHGETSVNPTTGEVTYTPDPNYYGSDSFTYTVDDDDGDTSNEATVDITVTSVNDPPVAVDDTASTPHDTPVLIDVLANDYDIDSGIDETTVDIKDDADHGTTSVDPNNGVVTYTPNPGYFGQDSFTYTVDDDEGTTSNIATVNITVGENHEPNKPDKPSGQTRGKWGEEYTYKTSTIDIDGDQVWYNFSWGDETYSGWVGPFTSGAIASANHKWTKDGWSGNFEIKVRAKDKYDAISEWSDPLPISMPKSYKSNINDAPRTTTQYLQGKDTTDSSQQSHFVSINTFKNIFSQTCKIKMIISEFIDFILKLLRGDYNDMNPFGI